MSPDLEGFFFILPCMVVITDALEVTILVMLAYSYTGVNPIFPTDGTIVLLPSQVASSGRLTDVYGLVRARTLITIDTFLFFWVRPCLVGTRENVL